jgi:protein phosphatase PTC1
VVWSTLSRGTLTSPQGAAWRTDLTAGHDRTPSPTHALSLQYLQKAIKNNPTLSIPDILNQTFHDVDSHLSKLAEDADGKMHSGCTAVTAFLRIEDPDGNQSFLENHNSDATIPASPERTTTPSPVSPTFAKANLNNDGSIEDSGTESPSDDKEKKTRRRSRIKNALKSLSHSSVGSTHSPPPNTTTPSNTFTPTDPNFRRVLYCANAGDARGVLCRGGKAIRLTYDHKGSDKQEAKRIMDAGGFVMSGRVNGVLAVTRSLGDSSMKEFVVGSPYTTETELDDEDEFVILACDGVSHTLTHDTQFWRG